MTDDTIEKLAIVAFGWLLGLLGPAVVDAIKRRRENKLGKAAIRAELQDVAHKIAMAVHYVHTTKATVDRPQLEWVKRHLERHAPVIDTAESEFLKSVNRQLAMSDEELRAYVLATGSKGRKVVVLQKHSVPLLDSRVAAMWAFDNPAQRLLLEIRSRLAGLDDIVGRSRTFLDMSFGTLSTENRPLVEENYNQCIDVYVERGTRIVDQVAELKHLL